MEAADRSKAVIIYIKHSITMIGCFLISQKTPTETAKQVNFWVLIIRSACYNKGTIKKGDYHNEILL